MGTTSVHLGRGGYCQEMSLFSSTKNSMVEPALCLFQSLKDQGWAVSFLCCDNGGKNLLLQKECSSANWKLGIQFEFMGRATPQQNSLAEVGFTTLCHCGMAMMHAANLPRDICLCLCTKAFATALLLDGLSVIELNSVSDT